MRLSRYDGWLLGAFLAAYLASGVLETLHRGTWQILGFGDIGAFTPRIEKSHYGAPLMRHDHIVAVDNRLIHRAADWYRITEWDSRPGQTLTIRLLRDNHEHQVQVTVPFPQWWYPLSWFMPLIPLGFWLVASSPVLNETQTPSRTAILAGLSALSLAKLLDGPQPHFALGTLFSVALPVLLALSIPGPRWTLPLGGALAVQQVLIHLASFAWPDYASVPAEWASTLDFFSDPPLGTFYLILIFFRNSGDQPIKQPASAPTQ